MENAKIAAAFVKAQKNFAPALKTNTNPAFRSKYVTLEGCIEAIIDALNDNGIALLQPTHECESGVMVETIFLHESGETLSGGRFHVPAAKQDPQGYGSALTYARRYNLMTACGIAPEDDDGNAASKPATSRVTDQAAKTINVIQQGEIAALVAATNADMEALMKWVSKASGKACKVLGDVPVEAYQPIMKRLQSKKEQAA